MSATIYSIPVKTIRGEETTLEGFQKRVLLIVNVASQCGFTPQYQGLQKLYDDYREKGLVVLGFPCNQFGGQEPGSESEIAKTCELNHGVTFPLYSKIDVNGPNAHPLYEYLKTNAKGILGTEAIKWNFTKFLVSRSGEVLKRYAPSTQPVEIEGDIKEALGA